ncbi:MAG: hypothetical protein E7568_00845 [Ruminococcaceae bacterium]|nr:hypothetical protein [Oscillospiraceae bacterium]
MKSTVKFTVYYLIAFVIFIVNLGFFVGDQMFFSINDLPKALEGESASYSAFSPDLKKVAECYTVNTPEGSAVRVELVTYDDNVNVADRKNIYWEVGKETVIIGWVDSNTITIDSKTLDLSRNQTYDCRKMASFGQIW